MLSADVVIVGGGVVGLAIASALSRQCPDHTGIVLLEQRNDFGQETSSRNSEVIHAGLYYPPDSQKARHCLRGREILYAYCQRHRIPFRRTGKLVVAGRDERKRLESLQVNALASGVAENELRWLEGDELADLEPRLSADYALLSTASGIVDSHALMQSLLDEACSRDVTWAPLTRVERVRSGVDNGFVVHACSGSEKSPVRLACRVLINAAGLGAIDLASRIEGLDSDMIPQWRLVKGQYFSWSGPAPFQHLIYPLPPLNGDGLGIHATLDLSGRLRFGPDAVPVEAPEYGVDDTRQHAFAQAISEYFPDVETHRLSPDYAGVRPKAFWPGSTGPEDFIISEASGQGLEGLIQLFGIESPGLTAALSIAEEVSSYTVDRLRRYGCTPR
ncbi:MAG: NAD(P)/FAD-dependent oxidoreductase [Pseudomonadota bacterium]